MRKLPAVLACGFILALTACQAVSDTTGTTLEQRCAARQVTLSLMKAQVDRGRLSEDAYLDYKLYVEEVCAFEEEIL